MTSPLRPTGQGFGTAAPDRPTVDRTLLRMAFLIPGGLSLLAGLNAALLLLGLPAPMTSDRLPELHAPLMVFGFIGTLVVLERAVAARKWWVFTAPALLGLGSLVLLTEVPLAAGKTMVMLGMVVLLAVYLVIWRRQPAASTAMQVLGAVTGLSATVLWLGGAGIPELVPGMAVFLILTIAGERLELARISPTVDARAERLALASALAVAGTATAAPLWPVGGYPLLASAIILLVVWLARYDVATRLVGSKGLPRYMAACLLAGYGWLAVASGIWLVAGPVTDGWAYDAVLHAIFLGFVMSMIMAHAPVILPAVLRKPLPYRPFLYLPVVLLHVSLALRLLVGDARELPEVVQWGGALNVVAVLLFVVLAVASAVMGPPRKPVAT